MQGTVQGDAPSSAIESAVSSTVHIAAKVRLNSSAWFRAIDDDDSGALVDAAWAVSSGVDS